MAEEYQSRNAAGECFVHIRKQYSGNKDLRALSGLTKGNKFYKVNLAGEEGEIGFDEFRQAGKKNRSFELQQ